jgi:O-antigen/teichoic acid export membrane protein
MSSNALLAFFALATIDIVVARTALDAHLAGIYAAGLILVKAVQFLPQFVTVVAYPAMARQGGGHRVHLGGLGLIVLIGGSATVVVGIWGDLALPLVGGDAYAEVVPSLWVFATIGTLLAAVQLLVYSALARAHHRAVPILWGAVAAILLSTPWVDSVGRLLTVTLSVDLVLLLVLLFVTRRGSAHAAAHDLSVRTGATA